MIGIITNYNDDGTVNIAAINENNSILFHVPLRQNSNSSQNESGSYDSPGERDIAILEGNDIEGWICTGVQSVIDSDGKFLNTKERIEPGDKWSIGPEGQKIGLLNGGIIWFFINTLCQTIFSKINNTITFIIENLKIIFPNISFKIETDRNKSEFSLKFIRDKVVKNSFSINEKLVDVNLQDKVTVNLNAEDNKATFDAGLIELGEGASQSVILGNEFFNWALNHSHLEKELPPTIPPPVTALSAKVKIK